MDGFRNIVAGQTAFALRLAGVLSAAARDSNSDRNLCFSPLSFHVVLSLLSAGAVGPTRQQLADVLGDGPSGGSYLAAFGSKVVGSVLKDGSPGGGPTVAAANGVWVQSGMKMKPEFEETATKSYRAEVASVDFATKAHEVVNQINSWVGNVTSGLITDLMPPGSLNQLTRLALVNALYFKGSWVDKFDAWRTKEDKFHLLNGSSVQAPFMTSEKKQFLSEYDRFQVLRLPYKHSEDERRFSMYIILPKAMDGLWNIAELVTSQPDFMDRHIPIEKVNMNNFKLPKFKITHEFEASEQLKKTGLTKPFGGGDPDFSDMIEFAKPGDFYVGAVYHKAFVEINEEGTEAAAATGLLLLGCSAVRSRPVTYDFVADHPFLFVIKEDTSSAVLFIGLVLNPLL